MKKYLHVIDQVSPTFTLQTIVLINEIINMSDNSKFITTDEKLFKDTQKYDNIVYEKKIVKYLNDNYQKFDYIFIHAMNFSIKDLLKINPEVMKKVIWCVWGHDLYVRKETKMLKKIKSKIKSIVKYMILKNIYAVGIGFGYDAIQVRKVVGNNPKIFFMPYGYEKGMKAKYEKIYNENKEKSDLKIMIGHSGYEFLNHIEIMKKLKRFENENIKISLILAYGKKEYIENVKKYAYDNFAKNKIEIIENLTTDEEYMRYLNSVDIAIFDFSHQAALGNIWKLAYLEKKIFLRDDGIIKTAFDLEFLHSNDVEELDTISFKELSEELSIKEKKRLHNYGELYLDDEVVENAWLRVLNYLEKR